MPCSQQDTTEDENKTHDSIKTAFAIRPYTEKVLIAVEIENNTDDGAKAAEAQDLVPHYHVLEPIE